LEESVKLLFVDDEQSILNCLKRLFMDDNFEILTCTDGHSALEMLKCNNIAVIISDNFMPGMRGIELLQQAKIISPDSVRIILTGHVDFQSAVDAINRGEVYKFVTKPWDNKELRTIVLQSVERHRIVQSLRKADEYSLCSLAQTIELKDPYTKGHCERVAGYATSIAEAMGLDEALRENIRRGSWLHDCGKIGVPEAILNHPGPLGVDEMGVIKKHPCWGADVARLAHLSETVVKIILHHHERFDGQGYPLGLAGEDIPLEARIVHVADIYDALTSDRAYRARTTREKAIENLLAGKGVCSDPKIVDIFLALLGRTGWRQQRRDLRYSS
jgi:putative two-component system response regulator